MAKKKRRSLYDTLSARDTEQDHELQETFQRVLDINTKATKQESSQPEHPAKTAQSKSSPVQLTQADHYNRSSIRPNNTAHYDSSHKEPNQRAQSINSDDFQNHEKPINFGDVKETRSDEKNGSKTQLNDRAHSSSSSEQPKQKGLSMGSSDKPDNRAHLCSLDKEPINTARRAQVNGSGEPLNRTLRAPILSPSNEPYAWADQVSPSEPTNDPYGEPQNVFLKTRSPIRSGNQRKLFDYLQRTGSQTTTFTYISNITGVPYSTTKRIMSKFQAKGFIQYKTAYIKEVGWCVKIWILKSDNEPYNQALSLSCNNEPSNWDSSIASKIDRSICLSEEGGPGGTGQSVQQSDCDPSSEERLKNLTDNDIAFFWPHLHKSGFGTHQVQQILERLSKVGKKPDKVIQGLDHAEYELENNTMTDKEGNAVKDPCSYVFNSLAKHGYYRRPSGYISPEEQAEMDAKKEAERLQKVAKEKKEAQFEAWKENLSEEELNEILETKQQRGPVDPWLRQYWEKNIS